jgi:hypothetical protein
MPEDPPAQSDRDAAGAPLPGAPLLAAHALWRSGVAGPEARAAEAARLGVEPEAFDAVVAFHARLATAPRGSVLRLCSGKSCQFEGADAYHRRLIDAFAAAGATISFERVHCLDECLNGPNVRFGDETFCAKTCTVVRDERTWRPPGSGPRPIDDPGAPPVLA